ncbi:MAG: LamG-like jellyroll fold domain-containing protein [Bacteriovoracaceae bacterium]
MAVKLKIHSLFFLSMMLFLQSCLELNTASVEETIEEGGTTIPLPTVSAPAQITIDEDTNTGPVIFKVKNLFSKRTLCSPKTKYTFDNTTLLENAGISVSGFFPDCQILIQSLPEQFGNAVINFTFYNFEGEEVTHQLNLVVDEVDDPPSLSDTADQVGTEDQDIGPIDFTIEDDITNFNCTDVILTTGNSTVLPTSRITISGTAPYCKIAFSPVPDTYGSSTVTLRFFDGTHLVEDTIETTFNEFNDPPSYTTAPVNQVGNEDQTISHIPVKIADIDTTLVCTNAFSVSSSNTTLLEASDFTFSGTAPDCLISYTPKADAFGSSTITLSLTDGTNTITDTFLVTVNSVNDAPSISTVIDQTSYEDNSTSAVNFTISDTETNLNCVTDITATSTNTTLLQNAKIAITGSAPNCSFTLTPEANESGTSTVTLRVSDGTTTTDETFTYNVTAVDDQPTLTLPSGQTILEDQSLGPVVFTASDQETVVDCTNDISVSSGDTSLIQNSSITLGGAAPNCTFSLTPEAGKFGNTALTFTLTDSVSSVSVLKVINIEVTAVEDSPEFTMPAIPLVYRNGETGELDFTLRDDEQALNCVTSITVASTDTTLIPIANVILSGTAPNCKMNIIPAATLSGTSTITLTATDGSGLSVDTDEAFLVTVDPQEEDPVVSVLTPLDDATGVSVDSNLTIQFDEDIAAGTGLILIKKDSDDSIIESIDITSSDVDITDDTLTINPTLDFPSHTDLYIELPAGIIVDVDKGNSFAGILLKTDWSFATKGTPFDNNFNFSIGSEYLCESGGCNSNYVMVSSGSASLLPLDLTVDSTSEYTSGNSAGVSESSSNLLLDSSYNRNSFHESWVPKFSNVVAYYSFDNDVNDASGSANTHNGTNSGMTYLTTSKVGTHSGSFDGADSVSINDHTDFDIGVGDKVSFSLWLKSTSTPANAYIIFDKREKVAADWTGYGLTYVNSNRLRVMLYRSSGTSSTTLDSSTVFNTGEWFHVGVTIDRDSTINLFVNGRLENTTNISAYSASDFSNSSNLVIGAKSEAASAYIPFVGELDEMIVWNDSVSSDQMKQIYHHQKATYTGEHKSKVFNLGKSSSWPGINWQAMHPYQKELPGSLGNESQSDYNSLVTSIGTYGDSDLSNSLIGLWHFNSSHDDFSNNSNTLTPDGATISSFSMFGAGSLLFDGVSDHTEVTDPVDGSLDVDTRDFSISLWVYSRDFAAATNDFLVLKDDDDASSNGFGLYIEDGHLKGYVDNSATEAVALSVEEIRSNVWNHIVYRVDRGVLQQLFINGKEVTYTTQDTPHTEDLSNTRAFIIGSDEAGVSPFRGYIDEVAIWNRAINIGEVQELYRRGANRIKFQVRSCAASDCTDQDALSGDGWIGPGGDNQSFFSEAQNCVSVDGSGDCNGDINLSRPYFEFADFVTAPTDNQYFQWRAIFESDDENDACFGSTCMPTLNNVSLNAKTGSLVTGSDIERYWGAIPKIENNLSLSFSDITSITLTETGSCAMRYQISNDGGATYYYHTGAAWAASANETTHTNTKAQLEANITSFAPSAPPSSDFKFKVLMDSDTDQTCGIDNINIVGED